MAFSLLFYIGAILYSVYFCMLFLCACVSVFILNFCYCYFLFCLVVCETVGVINLQNFLNLRQNYISRSMIVCRYQNLKTTTTRTFHSNPLTNSGRH